MADYFSEDSGATEPLNSKAEFGKEARDALSSLRRNVTKMKTEGKKIGGEQDNKQLRDTIGKLMKECGKLFAVCKQELDKLVSEESDSEAESKKRQRQYKSLMDNYMKIKNEFEEVGKAIAEKQKMYIENARRSATAGTAGGRGKGRTKADPNDPSL